MSSQAGLVTHNVADMRAEPNGRSERVSQAIMGDPIQIIEEQEGYARVQTADEYEGWILRRHLRLVTPDDSFKPTHWVSAQIESLLTCDKPLFLHLSTNTKLAYGTLVQLIKPEEIEDPLKQVPGMHFVTLVNGQVGHVRPASLTVNKILDFTRDRLVGLALYFLGTPYLWGGTTPFGIDCSGFVQRVYSRCGVLLPRDAHIQAQSPLGTILPVDELMTAGDLIFFCGKDDPRQRGITHVGMALDAGTIIHASGDDGVAIHALADPLIAGKYTTYGVWRLKESE